MSTCTRTWARPGIARRRSRPKSCWRGWTPTTSPRRSCCRWFRPKRSSYPLTTDFVLAETKPHRDRLIPFCSVDPRTSYTRRAAGAGRDAEEIRRPGGQGFWRAQAGREDRRRAEHDDLCRLRRAEAAGAVSSRPVAESRRAGAAGPGKRAQAASRRRSSSATARAGGPRSPA